MTDLKEALEFVREDIELSRSLGDGEDLMEMRRIETLLMKQERMEHTAYQKRVGAWSKACFGPAANDATERTHRFLEEALELVQATGCTQNEAHQLVDYVFGRPVGEPAKEAGGVMLTLAALCNANAIDMMESAEAELGRVWHIIDAIRAKHLSKPKGSPLPQAMTATVSTGGIAAIADERRRQIEQEGWTAEHDDKYDNFELVWAGITYAHHASIRNDRERAQTRPSGWPWADTWWKPTTRRGELVKSGALIAAEIDRLDRVAKEETSVCDYQGCDMPAVTELDGEKLCKFHASEWLEGEQRAANEYQEDIDRFDYAALKGGAA